MKQYSLDNKENPPFIRILRVVFGVACIAIAAIWALYMTKPGMEDGYWIATAFIFFFGLFQIYSGLGFAGRYLVFDNNTITLKKNAVGRRLSVRADEISSIAILPLSVEIRLISGKTESVTFGMSVADSIDPIKDSFDQFARDNSIEIIERSDRP